MDTTTAYDSATIQFMQPRRVFMVTVGDRLFPNASKLERTLPSDHPRSMVEVPAPIAAPWVAAVERRIRASVSPQNIAYINDGSTITNNVAARALQFFQMTWDVLPGEPYIYVSLQGDLVADFRTEFGTMTTIVAPSRVVTFASHNGELLDLQIVVDFKSPMNSRRSLQHLTKTLKQSGNGTLGPA